MTEKNLNFENEILAAKSHTSSYATNQKFREHWLGFSRESRNLRAQQLRAFGELVGSVTNSLSGWRVLDVGCGDGRWLRTFLEFDAKPADLNGIDISDERFEIGRGKNPSIVLMQTDGVTIPFSDKHFDLVTQFVTFSNIPTTALRQQVAKEIGRVVKTGGYIYWWDLFITTSPTNKNVSLLPSDYFDWPLRKLTVGEYPLPSECLRPVRGFRKILGTVLNKLSYPAHHLAALIGPKP